VCVCVCVCVYINISLICFVTYTVARSYRIMI